MFTITLWIFTVYAVIVASFIQVIILNKFPEKVYVLTFSYAYIKRFHEKEYLFRLSRRTMQPCDEETHDANATTADFDFLQESLAKVLTNQSAPFTKARFQNKNKRLRCIKVGNGPLKNVFKRLAASNLSFLTRTAWIVFNSLKLFTKPVVAIVTIFSLVKLNEGFMVEKLSISRPSTR